MTLRPILNDLTAHGLGWIGVVKIAGAWVPTRRLGKVMAVLSLSFLIGDAAVRATLAGRGALSPDDIEQGGLGDCWCRPALWRAAAVTPKRVRCLTVTRCVIATFLSALWGGARRLLRRGSDARSLHDASSLGSCRRSRRSRGERSCWST